MSATGTLLTPAMLARRWGISSGAVYNMLNAGTLPGFRAGERDWRIRIADVEAREAADRAATDEGGDEGSDEPTGPAPVLLTPTTLAERWGVSSTHICTLLNAGRLPAFRVGHLWRIRLADVEAWEAVPAVPPPPRERLPATPPESVTGALPDALAEHRRALRMGGSGVGAA